MWILDRVPILTPGVPLCYPRYHNHCCPPLRNLLTHLQFPIINSTHHLLPSPRGELAPAIEAILDVYGTEVTVVVAHNGQGTMHEEHTYHSAISHATYYHRGRSP